MKLHIRRAFCVALSGTFLQGIASTPVSAAIIEISVPPGSQLQSRPLSDNVWSVSVQGGTLSTTLGIGIIVNPSWLTVNDTNDFALHQNHDNGSPPYAAAYTPNAIASTVTYKFDRQTIVSGVEIVQHVYGATQISGSLDNVLLGTVFGPSGDVLDSFVVPTEGVSQVFNFGNTTVAGKTFKLTITKSNFFHAFALHRAFLLDETGRRIEPASAPTTRGPVGGLVHGVSGQKAVTCRNVTSGQQINFSIAGLGWNCEGNGLTVNSGDTIEQTVRATK